MAKFRVGDLVQLKSGSPTMTVTNAETDRYEAEGEIECRWFAGAKNVTANFPPQTLVHVTPEKT